MAPAATRLHPGSAVAGAWAARLAAAGPFGGLIASGWHTTGIFMRLFAGHYLSRAPGLGSPGVDELRWPVPVRPGDRLRLRTTIIETPRSRTKPDLGAHPGRAAEPGQPGALSLLAVNLLLLREPGEGQRALAEPCAGPRAAGRAGARSALTPPLALTSKASLSSR